MRDSCADEEDAPCVLLQQLPEALLRRIVECCDVASASELACTCVALRVLTADDGDSVWEAIATRRYGVAFWAAAAQRPAATARRLGCHRLELLRMLHWERRYERLYGTEWDKGDYVVLWRWRDGREELRHVLPHMLPLVTPRIGLHTRLSHM